MMLNTSPPATPTKKAKNQASLRARSANPEKTPIGKMEVKAHGEPHISLGNFTADNPPRGFSIHITPDPEPEAIVTQVTTIGSDKKYELILHIANYGNKTVNAKIWPL